MMLLALSLAPAYVLAPTGSMGQEPSSVPSAASSSLSVPQQGTGQPEMFSPEWRAARASEQERNLQALEDQENRFQRWEQSAKHAVNGICSGCGAGSGERMTTVPSDALAGILESPGRVASTVVQPVAEPAPVAPVSVQQPLGQRSVPLDIRPPAAR